MRAASRKQERRSPSRMSGATLPSRWQATSWLREGRLRHREDVLEGLDRAPGAIAGLYRGENLGKRLIRVGPG